MNKNILLILVTCFFTSACGSSGVTSEIPSATVTAVFTNTSIPTLVSTNTPAQIPTMTITSTQTSTSTPLPSDTPTATPIPTYVILRGQVNVDKANCRYGPGEPYLYKYGLIGGSNLEIIGRNATGSWIEIQAIGGTNPCWVKSSLLDIKGDVMNVSPILPEEVRLPQSPYYVPPSAVHAKRDGDTVILSWNAVSLRAGDDSGQYPYLIETWVCQAGQIVFIPYGTYETTLTVPDESGCSEPSHGRVYAVEKHGYTKYREADWPEFP